MRDAVEAYYLLLTKPKPGEAYNIEKLYLHGREILKYLLSISKVKNIRIITDKSRLTNSLIYKFQTTKFLKATDGNQRYHLKTMLDLLNY